MTAKAKEIIAELTSFYRNATEMSVSADLNHDAQLWWNGASSGLALAIGVLNEHAERQTQA
jgi:hypothetical protein